MKLQHFVEKAVGLKECVVAVAAAEDREVLDAVLQAAAIGMATFILYGNKQAITGLLEEKEQDASVQARITVVHATDVTDAARMAVNAVKNKEANVLMKGNLSTALMMKAVLDKEFGLRTRQTLSHVAAFEVSGYERLIFVTDSAMNIIPTLEQKVHIVENAVKVARSIGVSLPKVAPLAAVETVNPAMPLTLDAAALSVMNARGQISDCVIDGPLALDIAISEIAAEHKGIHSEVAGNADILLVPTLETGNILYKSLVYFAHAKVGGFITGAKAPIVLTSRSDSAETKLFSLALAICAT